MMVTTPPRAWRVGEEVTFSKPSTQHGSLRETFKLPAPGHGEATFQRVAAGTYRVVSVSGPFQNRADARRARSIARTNR